ncbi:MAG: signal peptidase II [bacterium]|nr:signal peptidase II [bacterium]
MKIYYVLLYLIGVLFLVFLDQYTKTLFVKGYTLKLNEYIKFILVYNEGSAFGIKLFNNETYLIIGFIVALFLIYFTIIYNKKLNNLINKLQNKSIVYLFNFSVLLILSGTIGNLIDRLKYSKVVDWISIWNFPVFNFADSYISIGVAIFIYSYWKLEKVS